MGAYCSKSTAEVPGGGGIAAPTAGTPSTASQVSSVTLNGAPARRDSERRGIRQGLVLEHKHVAVWDHYDKIGEIGTGMTGKVYLVKSKNTGEQFALKSMSVSRIDPELLEDLRNEIAILKVSPLQWRAGSMLLQTGCDIFTRRL